MSRLPRDHPAYDELTLDVLLQSARALDPKLDELSTARIEARLARQLAGQRARGGYPARWFAIAALSVAAALALLWLGRAPHTPRLAEPSRSLAHREPRRDTARATVSPADAEPALLTVYCIAGVDDEPLRSLLGRAVSRIELPRAVVVRATLGEHTRLSLQGPSTVRVASERAAHGMLELAQGRLVADFEGDGSRRLSVQTPHARIDVVGTRFAIDARASRTVIHVEHGTVQVELGERSVRVSDGETFDSRERAVRREAPPTTLARVLRDHARALLPPPAGEQRVLRVEGAGAGLRARLGDALLGVTPVVALVPLGEVAVTLEPGPRAKPSSEPREKLSASDAEALYAAAEDCMRLAEPTCARARLARLIADFGQSPQAATARYELARLAQDGEGCAAAAPLWADYLRRHPSGQFAATARERVARCEHVGAPP